MSAASPTEQQLARLLAGLPLAHGIGAFDVLLKMGGIQFVGHGVKVRIVTQLESVAGCASEPFELA